MSPECNHCGGHVTPDYVRVVSRPDVDGVDCCPRCEDRVRRGGEIVEARGPTRDQQRYQTGGPA